MKWLGLAIALLIGVISGWRPPPAADEETPRASQSPESSTAPRSASTPPASPPTPLSPAIAAKADPILGPDWHQWAQRIRSADSSDALAEIFDDLVAVTKRGWADRKIRDTAGQLLAARWLEIDPVAGADFLFATKDKAWALYPLLSSWYLTNPKEAQAALDRLPSKLHGLDCEVEMLKHFVKRDPDVALAYMKATGKYDTQTAFGGAAPWRALAKARPQQFAQLLSTVEQQRLQDGKPFKASSLLQIVAEEFTKQDPEAAQKWAEQDFDRRIRGEALNSVLRTMTFEDPLGVLARMDEWKNDDSRKELHQALRRNESWLAKALATVDLTVATEWLRKKGGGTPHSFAGALGFELGQGTQELTAAIECASGLATNNTYASNILFRTMWSHLSPEKLKESFDLLEGRPADAARTQAFGGLIRTTMSRDPDQALAFFRRLPAGPARDAITRAMFEKTNLERHGYLAADVIRQLPSRERVLAVSTLLKEKPQPPGESTQSFNPSVFVAALEESASSPERSAAIDRVATHWGAYDPVAALTWSRELPAEEAANASTIVAEAWVKEDAWSLGDHLLNEPQGPTRDAATSVLIDSLVEKEPDSAWAWAGHLSDAQSQRTTRRRVFEVWAKEDPVDARNALESSTLSNTEREHLQSLLPK